MTRDEFIHDVTTVAELIDAANEFGCEHLTEDVVDSDYYNDYVDDALVEWARSDTWQELRDRLNEIYDESGYDWYIYDNYYGRYTGLGRDEFNSLKRDILDWMDDSGSWDDEEEEEEEVQRHNPTPQYTGDPEIEALDLDVLSGMTEAIWGVVLDARPEPEDEPAHEAKEAELEFVSVDINQLLPY